MGLLSLPMEIFEVILYHAFQLRGIKRGLRLRLVNKTFAKGVIQAVYTFHLFDELLRKRHEGIKYIPRKVTSDYLEYRIMHEPTHGNPLLHCFRQVVAEVDEARGFCDTESSSIKAFVDRVWQLTDFGYTPGHFRFVFGLQTAVDDEEYELHLLAAALCTNTIPIIQRFARKNEGLLPTIHKGDFRSDLYLSHTELAARYGSKELLEFLMTSGQSSFDEKLRGLLFGCAARAGRADIVRFLYYFKKEETQWRFDQQDGLYADTWAAAQNTSDPDVWRFIEELRPIYRSEKPSSGNVYTTGRTVYGIKSRLTRCASSGSLEMLEQLLETAAQIDQQNRYTFQQTSPLLKNYNWPLQTACKHGRADIVDCLLKHGAEPNVAIAAAASRGQKEIVQKLLKDGLPPVNALSTAAARGHLGVIRILLDAGVNANEDTGAASPLVKAIAIEHEALFRLLIQRGADLHLGGVATECVKRAQQDGLESMLRLLEEYGVDPDTVQIPNPTVVRTEPSNVGRPKLRDF